MAYSRSANTKPQRLKQQLARHSVRHPIRIILGQSFAFSHVLQSPKTRFASSWKDLWTRRDGTHLSASQWMHPSNEN